MEDLSNLLKLQTWRGSSFGAFSSSEEKAWMYPWAGCLLVLLLGEGISENPSRRPSAVFMHLHPDEESLSSFP
jgi:hypothetical protein